MRTYSELSELQSFKERYEYLRLSGAVGRDTFGYDRHLNQALYKSYEWKRVRDIVLLRDNGCDLGLPGFEIYGKALIHHMNPITIEMIVNRDPVIFDPELLITVSHRTHNAIHYGVEELSDDLPIERKPNDTIPWRK